MRPALMVNPGSDARFAAAVAAALNDVETPEALAVVLGAEYPSVLVRPRSLSGEPVEVWYVYREGRWVNA